MAAGKQARALSVYPASPASRRAALVAIVDSDWLPPMLAGAHSSSAFNIGRYGQWAVTALAVLLTRRSSSTLDLWLGVALLQAGGHEVSEANDGADALRLAFAHAPEVILLDIDMPGMNGLEVARELRKQNHHFSPRIIAVTGWGQEKDRLLTRDAGFDFHLTKPVNHTELDMLLSLEPPLARPAAGERPALRH